MFLVHRTHLLHQIGGTLGQEHHSDEQQNRRNGTDAAECAPVDVGADHVDQENAHGEEELEEGAQRTPNGGLADFGDKHRSDYASTASGNARKDTGSVQHVDAGRGHGQDPGEEEGHAQQHARVLATQLIGQDTRGNRTEERANG